MRVRKFGRTDLVITELGLGGSQLGNRGTAIGEPQADAIVELARITHGEAQPRAFAEAIAGAYRALGRSTGSKDRKSHRPGREEWEPCHQPLHMGDFDCFLLGRYTAPPVNSTRGRAADENGLQGRYGTTWRGSRERRQDRRSARAYRDSVALDKAPVVGDRPAIPKPARRRHG